MPICVYGVCSSLKVDKDDLIDLVNLEVLSISYYRGLKIHEDVFANLSKLNQMILDCTNITTLPASMKYTCNILSLSISKNPFTNVRITDTSTWPILAFVPNYYKQLKTKATIESMTKF